ncbi:fibroblast growth factor receptor substrate 2-like [Plakobranchus ocellatus]|uniref:Fibroblast growth factor receptor substrate 2-like n=1 Tax=Plakobranchus ocellatus TaxID=259542 RepID=A0AAV4DHQ9_9GAST|nr:fibroblast growth factor receptor substrate 2-like [Plakobranchus ocellatus]
MGCTHSAESGSSNVQSFRVYNVNDRGVELHRGTIQICDGDLVLYQKNKNPIRWPLRCLRRYGYDAELFSFESGRRCAMPPGIYAFKCTRAEDLFNLVQDSIQRAGELVQPTTHHAQSPASFNGASVQHSRPSSQRTYQTTTTMSPPPENRPPPVAINGGYDSNSHLYVNGSVAQNAGHEYTNTSILNQNHGAFQIDGAAALVDFLHNPPGIGNGRSQVNYAELCMPDSISDPISPDSEAEQHRSTHCTDPVVRFSQSYTATEKNVLRDNQPSSASKDTSCHQAAKNDMFPPMEDVVSANYVNLTVEENDAAAGGAAAPTATGGLPSVLQAPNATSVNCAHPLPPPSVLPSTQDMVTNYANLALQPPKASKAVNQVNYILIEHKYQNGDSASGAAGNGNNSPISPTDLTPFPESPSRKTESYAVIDFDRTVALSNVTKPVEDEGGRKTRHNSTIEGIP